MDRAGRGTSRRGPWLTSIGLNITETHRGRSDRDGHCRDHAGRRCESIAGSTYGIVGAAWANALGHRLLALVSWRFSQRFYPYRGPGGTPCPHRRRGGSGPRGLSCRRARLPAACRTHRARGHGTGPVYAGILPASGFLAPQEIEHLVTAQRRIRRRQVIELPADVTELAGDVATSTPTDTAEVVEER